MAEKSFSTQQIFADPGSGASAGHVVVQETVHESSTGELPAGTMVIENIQLATEGGSVVYIVHPEGLDIDGVTYAMLEGSSVDQLAVETGQNSNSVNPVQINDSGILTAVSGGQIQVIEAAGSAGKDTRTVQTLDVSSNISKTSQRLVKPGIHKTKVAHGPKILAVADKTEVNSVKYVFKCQYCDTSSETLEELEQHLSNVHGVSIEVENDVKSGKNLTKLVESTSQDSGAISIEPLVEGTVLTDLSNCFYKCPFCPQMFSPDTQGSLEQHILESHPGKSIPKEAVSDSSITAGEKKTFPCLLCEKVFRWPQSLKQHVQESHTAASAEELEKFKEIYGISVKKWTGKDITRFSCMLCDKQFKWPKSLKSHLVEFHCNKEATKLKISKRREEYFKCVYCNLVTRYACSIRKHIERKHQEKVDGLDVSKLEIPKVDSSEVKNEVICLDTRPPEIRLSSFSKIYRCPFCEYATQLPSNLTRHLTSRNHNYIFTLDDIKRIKIKSFMVTRDGSKNSDKLPPLKLKPDLKEIIRQKKQKIGLPDKEEALMEEVDTLDDEEQEMEELSDEEKKTNGNKANYAKTFVKNKEIAIQSTENELHEDTSEDSKNITENEEKMNCSKDDSVNSSKGHGIMGTENKRGIEGEDKIQNSGNELDIEEKEENHVSTTGPDVAEVPGGKLFAGEAVDERKPDQETATCCVCKKSYIDIKLLLQHVATHDNMKVNFSCQVCQEEFTFFSTLKIHMENKHGENNEPVLPMSTVVLSVVKESSRKPLTTHECPYCEMLFAKSSALQKHVTVDHVNLLKPVQPGVTASAFVPRFNCLFCELSFVSLPRLVQHMHVIHPGQERPGVVEDLPGTPTRKSSRKRKLPKWLEKDMDVSEELGTKRKKVMSLPLRIDMTDNSVSDDTDTRTEQGKQKEDMKIKAMHLRENHKAKLSEPNSTGTSTSAGFRKKTAPILPRKQAQVGNKTTEKIRSPGKIALKQSKQSTPKIRKESVSALYDSDALTQHKCPHCNFTAKRSAALTFHLNFNHQNVVKSEPFDPDYETEAIHFGRDEPSPLDSKKSPLKSCKKSADAENEDRDVSQGYNTFVDITKSDIVTSHDKSTGVEMDKLAPVKMEKHKAWAKTKQSGQEKFTCLYCHVTFGNETEVRKHVKDNHRSSSVDGNKDSLLSIFGAETAYKCTVCPVLSSSVEGVLLHTEVAHPLEFDVAPNDIKQTELSSEQVQVKFLCPYCPFKSKWKMSIPWHVGKHHPRAENFKPEDITCEPELEQRSFLCPYCLGVMASKTEVIQHVDDQHSSQPRLTEEDVENVVGDEQGDLLKCQYCETHSRYKENIVRHVNLVHPEKTKKFEEETKQMKQMAQLKKLYSCKHCALETPYFSCLKRHMKRWHAPTELDADVMAQDISVSFFYFKCKYCNILCRSKSEVIAHAQEQHKTECTLKDDEITTVDVESSDVYHQMFYRCPVCNFGDHDKEKLIEHVSVAHDEMHNFQASDLVCELKKMDQRPDSEQTSQKSFTITSGFKKGRKLHKCSHCEGESFKSVSELNRHYVEKHSEHEKYELNSKTSQNVSISGRKRPVDDLLPNTQTLSGTQPTEGETFQCGYCDVTCKWKKSVIRHIRMSHPGKMEMVLSIQQPASCRKGTKLLQCKRCVNQKFKTIPCLRKHYVQYHPEHVENLLNAKNFQYIYTSRPSRLAVNDSDYGFKEQFQCVICGALYLWKKSLYVHVKTNHPKQREVYQVLDKMVDVIVDAVGEETGLQAMDTGSAVTKSSRGHGPSEHRRKKCGLCSATFLRKWQVRAHYCLKHGPSGRKWPYKTGLSSFQRICRVCGLGFFTGSVLLHHIIMRHRIKALTNLCTYCGRRCSDAKSLNCHRVVCLQKWKRQYCQVEGCNFSTKFQAVMRNHLWKKHGLRRTVASNNLKCEICSQLIGNVSELRQHIQQHQKNKINPLYPCDVCRLKFKSQAHRDEHMQTKHIHLLEVCDICGQTLPSKKSLELHQKKHEQGQEVVCQVCGETYTRGSISNHYIIKHPEMLSCNCDVCQDRAQPNAKQDFRCSICMKNFCQKQGLLAHNHMAHGAMKPSGSYKRRYECKICKQVFFTLKAKNKHVGTMHDIKSVLLQENQQFSHVDGLTGTGSAGNMKTSENSEYPTTQVIHIGQGETTQYLPKLREESLNAVIKELILYTPNAHLPFKCMLCSRSFGKSKYIKLHIRRSHVKDENQPYRCKICGSGFVRLTEFRKHTRSHSDFRPYRCKYCNKAFKQQANLRDHFHVHSDIKQYHCYICRRTFRQRGGLTSHVVGHDTLKPFRCMFCDRGFTTRGELSRHMKKYDRDGTVSEKSYSCHMCMESFPHFPLLMKHIEQHNPEKPFQCQLCLERFSNFVSLYFHKVKHGHFVDTEIIPDDGDITVPERTVRKVKRDTRRSKNAKIDEAETIQEAVYLTPSDDLSLLQNTGGSTIEVIIEELDQNEVVHVEDKQPEHEELLSIAQQLTELSSIAEKGTMLKEEDEIVKNMLDADAEVLANLNMQIASEQKWESRNVQYDKEIVQDYYREHNNAPSQKESTGQEVKLTSVIRDMVNGQHDQMNSEGEMEGQTDIPAQVETSVPNNIEELAHLIAQNAETGDENDVLAYQNEDGSVIYVCLPGKDDHTNTVVESQVIESNEGCQSDELVNIAGNATKAQEIYAEVTENQILQDGDKETVSATRNIPLEAVVEEHTVDEDAGDENDFVEIENEGNPCVNPKTPCVEVTGDGTANNVDQTEEESEDLYSVKEEQVDEGTEENVIEYQNDETTFIREELLDGEYEEAVEHSDELMGNFKYAFVEDENCFACLHCDAKITNIKNLKTHMKRHIPEKRRPFACEYCPKKFITSNELKRHVKIHLGERDYKCDFCEKRFIQAGHLAEHRRVHTGQRPYQCKDCKASFSTGTQCKQHWRRIHGEAIYPCNLCEQRFKSIPDLTRHKGQAHSTLSKKEKPQEETTVGGEHVCHMCGHSYAKRNLLMLHLYQHSMENVEFRCNDCEKTFKSKESLNAHWRAKHEGQEHICTHCGEAFSWKKSLQRHMQTNHKEPETGDTGYVEQKQKPKYKCEHCGKVFASTMSLAYHMGSNHVD